jgi:hypothetical protein
MKLVGDGMTLMRDNGIVGTKIVSTDLNGFRTIDTPVVLRETFVCEIPFDMKEEGKGL